MIIIHPPGPYFGPIFSKLFLKNESFLKLHLVSISAFLDISVTKIVSQIFVTEMSKKVTKKLQFATF